jgi:hypothetical protein
MRCSIVEATYGVIGHHNGDSGVLYWHDNEFAAYAEARRIRLEGGDVRVEKYDNINFKTVQDALWGKEPL